MSNPKTYHERFTCFKNLHCPYCGSDKAGLEEIKRGKKRYVGHCKTCGATNNFTNPNCNIESA